MFGVKKYHQYLLGSHFVITSDHKHYSIYSVSVTQFLKWHLPECKDGPSTYDYKITFKPGQKHANADLLSRLPLWRSGQDWILPLKGR